jgi:hypothetical protein
MGAATGAQAAKPTARMTSTVERANSFDFIIISSMDKMTDFYKFIVPREF